MVKHLKSEETKLIKVVFMGDSYVGKTSLLTRINSDRFVQKYVSTIGTDFAIRTAQIEGILYKFQLWDTAGQQRFRGLSAVYHRGANIVCLCFDLNNSDSVANLHKNLQQIKTQCAPNTKTFIIGCKKDLQSKVPVDTMLSLCEQADCDYAETSAKTGFQVESLFERMCEAALAQDRQVNMQKSFVHLQQKQLAVPLKQGRSCGC